MLEEERAEPTGRTRAVRFGLVGLSGVLVNLGLQYLLVSRLGLHYGLAGPLAIEASILSNFLGNRLWTWKDRDSAWHAILSFQGVALVGLAVQWISLVAGVELLGLHYLVASLLGIAVGSAWNFLAHHYFTFAHVDNPIRRRLTRPVLYAAALLVQVIVAIALTQDWDSYVFQTSTAAFLKSGVTPYETAQDAPGYTWTGTGGPSFAQWYAYPPLPLLLTSITFAPSAFGWISGAWAARLLAKLPFILGSLLLAYAARHLVRAGPWPNADAGGDRLERLLLFNPLVILVGSVWGMFEALMLCSLIGMILALRARRAALAGMFLGAATLLKLFPIFLVPVLIGYIVRRQGWRPAFRFGIIGAASFAVVSLPFFILSSQGFFLQVFLMHATRPAAGFSPLGMANGVVTFFGGDLDMFAIDRAGLTHALGLAGLVGTVVAVGLTTLASLRAPASERNLLFFLAGSMSWALFLNKVLHEQYFLLAFGLWALYVAHPEPRPLVPFRRFAPLLRALTFVVPAAALISNAHFLLFIPPDIARPLFGTSVDALVESMARVVGLHAPQLAGALFVVASVMILRVFAAALPMVRPTLGAGIGVLHDHLPTITPLRRPVLRRSPAVGAAFLVAFLLPAVAAGTVFGHPHPDQDVPPTPSGARLAGVAYDLRWVNPSHDPLLQYGSWEDATLVPYDGFYSLTTYRIEKDVLQIRAAGFDYVLGVFNPATGPSARSLALACESAQLRFSLLLDVRSLLSAQEEKLGFEAARHGQLARLVERPYVGYWDDPALLRMGPEERIPIFLAGLDAVAPTFTDDELEHVAELNDARLLDASYGPQAAEIGRTVLADRPRSPEALATPAAEGWRLAYRAAELEFWADVFDFLDQDSRYELILDAPVPPTLIQALPGDVDVLVGPRLVSPDQLIEQAGVAPGLAQAFEALAEAETGSDAISPILGAFNASRARPAGEVHPAVEDDGLALDARWAALVADPSATHVIYYAWNGFHYGSALEPTLELGGVPAARTAQWLAQYHGQGGAVEPWDPVAQPIPPAPESFSDAGYPLRGLAGTTAPAEPTA